MTVVKQDHTIYGVTYRWRESNDDADLVATGQEAEVEFDNGTRQPWLFPGPQDCMTCHTHASGYVLGPNTRQLNRDFHYPSTGKSDNQLRTLNQIGLFSTPLQEDAIDNYERLYPLDDQSVSLDKRVRSYLASNCSQCHTTGGVNANWFADYAAELSDLGVLDAKPLNHIETTTDEERHKKLIAAFSDLAKCVDQAGCKLALYNYGSWFGKLDVQLAVIEGVRQNRGIKIGTVLNFHRGHQHMKDFPQVLEQMMPHLYAVNLNGMNWKDADYDGGGALILPLGSGDYELTMMRQLAESGYRGPIGIIDHRSGVDAEVALQENLDGLVKLREKLK